ncbi:Zinc finger SWIM-type [Arabidopsis thaliana x Arabidopsis arenosa]|uniref:Zinc finger SWIM-type n=1 Tax=Arabidopsis thaliana x Arabidopsis arenosa TaxID=1240361 RepID=A0A8T2A6J5_9BRAS|nr:Zinc finger SWIM-type [Arabidopsis thaliana x Arabidopsis arenosa]
MNEPAVFKVVTKTMPENNIHRGDDDLGGVQNHSYYHNVYGMLMARSTYEGMELADKNKRPFVLTRAGFIGSQRYAATWTGDNLSNWEHLHMSISMVLQLIDAVVYLVDAYDKERFAESKKELDALLSDESLANVPFLVLGNKLDIPYAASEDELRYNVGLTNFTTGKEQYYKRKAVEKQPIYTCSMDGEAYGDEEEQKSEDEDETYRFDCCDDTDGASSGDEDYGKSYKFSDEETNDEDGDDEEILKVEQEENAEEAEVKDEEDEEMVDVLKKERRKLFQLARGCRILQKIYAVKCWVNGCRWRVRATTIDAFGNFHIKVYVNQHMCSVTERSARCRQATKDILGVLYKNFVGGVGPGVENCVMVSRIRRANSGTLTSLEVDELDRFKYVFISFGATIDGFTFMRKVIVVDGTFLKGKYLGTLLLAITQDRNFNIFPLAFAVVDSENDESWEWFFRQLSCVIPDDHGLAIISDRHKSIAKAIGTVYPQARRGICTYHLHKNIKLRFRGSETFGLVKKAATAYMLADFNATFDIITALYPGLHSYLVRADVTTWSRVHFPEDRYNFTTSDIDESLNKVLYPARRYHIVELLDDIRLTRWYATRRKQAALMTTVLTKGVEKALEEIDPHQYEVRSVVSINVVNLTQKNCTCRMFDLDKLPCIHVIAAAQTAHVSRISKSHPYYRSEYLRNGYSKIVMPKDEACSVPESVTGKFVNPPFVKVQSGRPKMSRIKGHLEVASPYACSMIVGF